MRRSDVIVFDRVSDVTPEEYVLTDEELLILINRRYRTAGNPEDRLKQWLDAHNVYPKRDTVFERVLRLPHEGLVSLLAVLQDWAVEVKPPGSEGEFE